MWEGEPLSVLARFYIYALHGFATEVAFTAGWEFVVNTNWRFPGNTSMWSFIIYGLSALFIERLHLKFTSLGTPLLLRVVVYTLWTYLWEFTSGYILTQFNACPWDYTLFDGNFMGLITIEYLPAWFVANVIMDLVLIRYVLRLRWATPAPHDAQANGHVKSKIS